MEDRVRSVAAATEVELEPRKGSRFVAVIAPVTTEVGARAVVSERRERDPDASHHCWAFRLADDRALVDDDGEPGGTAGPPILRHLDGAELRDVVVVVTRWFGGTKLGTGGLVRAYGDAAAAAMDAARIVDRPVLARFTLVHDYNLTGPVDGVLARHGATQLHADYAGRVHRRVVVARSSATAFVEDLRDATAGRLEPVRTD